MYVTKKSSSIETVTLDGNLMTVTFKSNVSATYVYSIKRNYVRQVKTLLEHTESLGKSVNFIIRSGHCERIAKLTTSYEILTIWESGEIYLQR